MKNFALIILSFCTLPVVAADSPFIGETNKETYVYNNMQDQHIEAIIAKDTKIEVLKRYPHGNKVQFGNEFGFIKNSDVTYYSDIDYKIKVKTGLDDILNINDMKYVVVQDDTPIFEQPTDDANILGTIKGGIRYPSRSILLPYLSFDESWRAVKVAGLYGYVKYGKTLQPDFGVPVITYHHILKDAENKYFKHTSTTTSDTVFHRQMKYLHDNNYSTISAQQLYSYLTMKSNIPAKAVLLTFDDGLQSVYRYAYPVLKAYKQKATVFVISSRVKKSPGPWDPNSLEFMSSSELSNSRDVFDIESHSHFLHRYDDNNDEPIIYKRNYHNIFKDIIVSRIRLKRYNNINYFAYPFGAYTKTAVSALRNAGIKMAFTTIDGKVKPTDNLLLLKRLYVLRTDPEHAFAQKIENIPTH
ncbi:polysaccharide deacetylase family protein [Plesiomonas shigelloides]|uniref:Polysaccharide deacetylase n=1 Tax=Plesiomonas shigelloides 302-73 TaxID=1315976 RepID=R8AQF7_PLESH|nr:polysaccharide deacetylase family protein [Plesiomonas shigelloides]EON88553.1 polysaccharide deacetylase [Plesiomonas shigelloides 302-73]